MSWAAGRKTSRVEDRAYSLLGLFQVNMPMLYGEKSRAFMRLQEEILRTSTDQSIIAWGAKSLSCTSPSEHELLLARSPDDFAGSGVGIEKPPGSDVDDALEMTSAGLRISTYLLPSNEEQRFFTALNCAPSASSSDRVCVLSVRELPASISHDSRPRFYINAASRLDFISDERGHLFSPESRLDSANISELSGQKRESIVLSRGIDTTTNPATPGMIASGIRLRLADSLQIADAHPKTWMDAAGGKLENLSRSFYAPQYNVTRWDGALRLQHRDGNFIVLLLCVEQRDPHEQPDYSVGFHDGEG